MNHLILAFTFLAASVSFAEDFIPKYGPRGSPRATLLRSDPQFVRQSPAVDFWALMPYYAGMQGGHSASAASTTMVLNAIRKDTSYSSSDELVTETLLLGKLPKDQWLDRISGEKPVGVDLTQLAKLVQSSTSLFAIANAKIKAIQVVDHSPATIDKVRKRLIENEKSDKDFIIANYLQSAFTNDPEGAVGTFSPVAAFDEAKDRVLIFETDRKYYEPYWVSLKDFVEGLSQLKDSAKKPVGGLIVVAQ